MDERRIDDALGQPLLDRDQVRVRGRGRDVASDRQI
jgi:hypothetical protein